MGRRPGATLVEVLVAIFVMGIGMIALLTLFPLGVLRMGDAIQDDRSATAVNNANAVAVLKNIRNDFSVMTPPWFSGLPLVPKPADVFKDAIPSQGRNFMADPNGPSYPVLVDPIGCQNAVPSSTSQYWLGGSGGGSFNPLGLIARCPTTFTGGNNTLKWFALLDDLNFESEEQMGGTSPPAGSPLQREVGTTWAYLVQRPRSSDPSIASCSVVVYNKRPLSLTGGLALPEAAYNATFVLNKNTISVDWSGASPPDVRTGHWILDCTPVVSPSGKPAPDHLFNTAHGYFYRVVGITETGATSADYEVQQPIRGFPLPPFPPLPAPPTRLPTAGVIMVLDGVVEVYERGLDRKFN